MAVAAEAAADRVAAPAGESLTADAQAGKTEHPITTRRETFPAFLVRARPRKLRSHLDHFH